MTIRLMSSTLDQQTHYLTGKPSVDPALIDSPIVFNVPATMARQLILLSRLLGKAADWVTKGLKNARRLSAITEHFVPAATC